MVVLMHNTIGMREAKDGIGEFVAEQLFVVGYRGTLEDLAIAVKEGDASKARNLRTILGHVLKELAPPQLPPQLPPQPVATSISKPPQLHHNHIMFTIRFASLNHHIAYEISFDDLDLREDEQHVPVLRHSFDDLDLDSDSVSHDLGDLDIDIDLHSDCAKLQKRRETRVVHPAERAISSLWNIEFCSTVGHIFPLDSQVATHTRTFWHQVIELHYTMGFHDFSASTTSPHCRLGGM